MSKTKSVVMTEAEIQNYERLLEGELIVTESLAREFERLLRSYRLAANVANTAWAMLDALDDLAIMRDEGTELTAPLRAALAEYAPKHFPRMEPETLDALENLFNEATAQPGAPASFLDWFFGAIMRLRETELT